MKYIYRMEYSAPKRNEEQIHETKWMNLQNILIEKIVTKDTCCMILFIQNFYDRQIHRIISLFSYKTFSSLLKETLYPLIVTPHSSSLLPGPPQASTPSHSCPSWAASWTVSYTPGCPSSFKLLHWGFCPTHHTLPCQGHLRWPRGKANGHVVPFSLHLMGIFPHLAWLTSPSFQKPFALP